MAHRWGLSDDCINDNSLYDAASMTIASTMTIASMMLQVAPLGHDLFIWDMTHLYGTWLIRMGHTHLWGMSDDSIDNNSIDNSLHAIARLMYMSCDVYVIWMSYAPYEWVMSRWNESCPISDSCLICWQSHVPYEWVMSYMNESCPMCTSHVSSAPLFARLRCSETSIYAGDTTHFTYVMWQKTRDSLICDMTHSCVTWLIHMGHGSFIWDMIHSCVTCLIRMGHDSFIRDMTYSYGTWLTVHGTWLTCMCHRISSVGRSYDSSSMWYYSLTCDMKPLLIAVPMTDHICDITDIYVTWSVLYSSFEMWLDSLFKWDTTHLRGTWHRPCMHFIWLTVYVTWLDYTWHDIACKRKS